MKHNLVSKLVLRTIVAFIFAFSTVVSLVTGFDLPVEMPVIIFYCAVFAVSFSVLFSLPHGWKIAAGFGLAVLLYIWNNQSFIAQAQTLIYRISFLYHSVCGWDILGEPAAETVMIPILLWAAVSAACVIRYYHFGVGLYVLLISAVTPFGLCMITLDTVPDLVYIFLLLFSFGIILITDWTGRNMDHQRVGLSVLLGIPVAVFLSLLFWLNPQDKYVYQGNEFFEKIESWVEEMDEVSESVSHGATSDAYNGNKLNLQNIGPKSNLSFVVMYVNSPIDGSLYLRGRDYDIYTGLDWQSSGNRDEAFTSGSITRGKLDIRTTKVRDVLYIPYYSTKPVSLEDGASWNDNNILEYSYYISSTPTVRVSHPDGYTQLPLETQRWAVPLVNKITADSDSQEQKILAIKNYVKSSASYNRRTPRMSSGYDDFAQWFLEESDRGYCVHFATSATVLLRAAGIQARYVEGYLVSASALTEVTVTNRDAHAWVEYFDMDSGVWRILEATPPDSGSAGTETTEATTRPTTEPTHNQTESESTETLPTITEPSVTDPQTPTDDPTKPEDPKVNPVDLRWLETVLWIILAVVCVVLQSELRIYWKRKQWDKGKSNVKTVFRWHLTKQFAKHLNQRFPEELDALAQKAKFSQHLIQPEELRQFDTYRNLLTETLRHSPWYKRLLFRIIFALN